MTEQDCINRDIIIKIVSQHFSLEKGSLDFFTGAISSQKFIAPEILALLDEDKRKRFPLTLEMLEKHDEGWKIFKAVFPEFIKENEITYENFNTNSFKGKKLFKNALKEFDTNKDKYIERMIPKFGYYAMRNPNVIFDHIGSIKFPLYNENLKIVFSANFADWFLCSTAESWGSCLDLESDYDSSYWTGLPGLIGDSNRIMIYLTDGSKKEYEGIVVDKCISRMFGIIANTGDQIAFLKQYPINIINAFLLEELCPSFKFYSAETDTHFYSKYPITPLYFNNEYQCFPYNDVSELQINDLEDIYIVAGRQANSGCTLISKEGKYITGNKVFYSKGLTYLLKTGKKIEEFFNEFFVCEECGLAIGEADAFKKDNNYYCEECFNRRF